MTYKEFSKEIETITDGRIKDMYFTTRLLGACYGKFMYKKSFTEDMRKYHFTEVLSALKTSWEFTHKFQLDEFKSKKHYSNILLIYVQRNLDNGYYEEIDSEIPDDYEL